MWNHRWKDYCKFVVILSEEAMSAIPKSPGRKTESWWNDSCAKAKEKMSSRHKIFRKHSTEENERAFLESKNEMKKIVYESKSESRRNFTSTLSSRTLGTQVQNTLKGLYGRSRKQLPRTAIIQGKRIARTNRSRLTRQLENGQSKPLWNMTLRRSSRWPNKTRL